jgi:DNA (cytosine-5)-methyltransferase 1
MSTLDVVAEILHEVAPRALKARQIAELAGARLPTASRTPETVVSRDLAVDVRDHGAASRFLRVGRGEFLLKHALPTALYNDTDEYVARWSRRLVDAGELPYGIVDERSVRDLKPADVASYRQFHAFSGLGTWARALRDAGWPEEWPVWSGSCPCQGMSQAGRRLGFADPRHLWPDWFRLIDAVRPPFVFGEQVASKDGLAWLELVLSDLDRAGYTVGATDTCAAGFGAPHLRQRLYFVAVSREGGRALLRATRLHDLGQSRHDAARRCEANQGLRASSELGDARLDGTGEHGRELLRDEAQHEERPAAGDHASFPASATHSAGDLVADAAANDGDARSLVRGSVGSADDGQRPLQPGDRVRIVDDPTWGGAVRGHWAADIEWVWCRPPPGHEDGCFRPAPPSVAILADGASAEMAGTRAKRLRSIGNAIVLPQAVVFVECAIETICAWAVHKLADNEGVDVVSDEAVEVEAPVVAAPTEAASDLAWTGPREGETAPSGMLYGRVPGDRWPYGPPSAHEARCNLFPHRGSPGGLFCDCAASAADDVAYGVGA